MKYIISGTDRPSSYTYKVAVIVQSIYQSLGEKVEIIDMQKMSESFSTGPQYGALVNERLKSEAEKILTSDGLIVITPEYNGSMPGILKYFIDHLKYPDSFHHRPICFIGLGGMFGGLRPVEHLQQVFGYRNGFLYPDRIFLMGVTKAIVDGKIQSELIQNLMVEQAKGFQKFCKALMDSGLHALTLSR